MAEGSGTANEKQAVELDDNRSGKNKMFTRPWWILLLLTALFVCITCGLGFWQLGRAQLREQIEADQARNLALPELTEAALLKLARDEQLIHRRLSLRGEWLPQWSGFLNRPKHGQAGFWVMTPLKLEGGAVVLVQRGWAPRDPINPNQAPALQSVSQSLQISGQWITPPSRLMELGRESSQPDTSFTQVRQNLDLSQYERETGLQIRAVVRQSSEADDGLSRDWPSLASKAQTNRGYAFQWFAIAAAGLILFLWFQVIRKRRIGSEKVI